MTALSSILLAFIALVGAWIAFQQMMIARARLNHDLFDRRYAVYIATRNHIKEMLQYKGGTQENAETWWAVACSAPFLFDKKTADYIKEIGDRGSRMRGRVGAKPIYEDPEHVGEYNEQYMWMIKEFDGLEERFQGSLNLSTLTPFPVGIRKILRVPWAHN
jgi:hypothetical protein